MLSNLLEPGQVLAEAPTANSVIAQLVKESSMECLHPGTCRVAGSSHSDGELWHNFLGQETHTQLPLSTQEYK